MKTRDELIQQYLEDSGGTSGGQRLALMRLCKELEHLGYLKGYQDGAKQTGMIFATVGALRWPEAAP